VDGDQASDRHVLNDAGDARVDAGLITTAGREEAVANVSIGPKFLQLFSEQLYSSPNEAFEELAEGAVPSTPTVVAYSSRPAGQPGAGNPT
jgi:hypothetical protein